MSNAKDVIEKFMKIPKRRTYTFTEMELKFKKLTDTAIPFKYQRAFDACMDMYADEDKVIKPKTTELISTGIALELPRMYEGIVRGRSGLNSKGIFVMIGTIDPQYRGDIKVVLYNSTDEPFQITKGMRISQFTVKPIYYVRLVETNELSSTDRGSKGFGSSGLTLQE